MEATRTFPPQFQQDYNVFNKQNEDTHAPFVFYFRIPDLKAKDRNLLRITLNKLGWSLLQRSSKQIGCFNGPVMLIYGKDLGLFFKFLGITSKTKLKKKASNLLFQGWIQNLAGLGIINTFYSRSRLNFLVKLLPYRLLNSPQITLLQTLNMAKLVSRWVWTPVNTLEYQLLVSLELSTKEVIQVLTLSVNR